MTLILLIVLTTGGTMSREVPAAKCAPLAAAVIQQAGVSTASCWHRGRAMQPVFSTISL